MNSVPSPVSVSITPAPGSPIVYGTTTATSSAHQTAGTAMRQSRRQAAASRPASAPTSTGRATYFGATGSSVESIVETAATEPPAMPVAFCSR